MRDFIGRVFGFDKEIESLKGKISSLSWDDAFGMWTRSAFLHFCEIMPRGERCVFLLDFEDIHGLNQAIGYRAVDERINRTFSIPFRSSDLIARWYSGDEIVILFDGALAGAMHKMRELEASAAAHGLSFRWEHDLWRVGEEKIKDVVDRMAARLCRARRPPRLVQHTSRTMAPLAHAAASAK